MAQEISIPTPHSIIFKCYQKRREDNKEEEPKKKKGIYQICKLKEDKKES